MIDAERAYRDTYRTYIIESIRLLARVTPVERLGWATGFAMSIENSIPPSPSGPAKSAPRRGSPPTWLGRLSSCAQFAAGSHHRRRYAGLSSLAGEPHARGSGDQRRSGRDREAHWPAPTEHSIRHSAGKETDDRARSTANRRRPPWSRSRGRSWPGCRRQRRKIAEGRWDFNTPDLPWAYADWLKARADVPFNEKQLAHDPRANGGRR